MNLSAAVPPAPYALRPHVWALFALLVGVTTSLLFVNHARLQKNWPVDTPAFAQAKAELSAEKDPKAADALLPKIRQADLVLRQQYFLLRQRQLWGGYLLLAELALLAVSLKGAFAAPIRPGKPAQVAEPVIQVRSMLTLRNLLGLAACGLLAAGVAMNFFTGPSAGAAAAAVVKTPTAPPPGDEQLSANWARFRGPTGSGIATFTDIPEEWDAKTGKNILWKTPIELEGASSPIVWGKKVFLTGASKEKRAVYCLDADSGKILWQQEVPTRAGPPDVLEDTGYAAPTPATDGRYVVAIFATGDLVCLDLGGHMLWTQPLGPLDSTYGYSSSLSTYKDSVLVLLDQGGVEDKKSRVAAFDLASGKQVWSTPRPVGGSWASPIIIPAMGGTPVERMGETPMPRTQDAGETHVAQPLGGELAVEPPSAVRAGETHVAQPLGGELAVEPPSAVRAGETPATQDVGSAGSRAPSVRGSADATGAQTTGEKAATLPAQYITDATPLVISYDPATGRELWRAQALESEDIAPSPISAGGMVYTVNAGAKLSAIRPDGHGDVTATHVAWSADDGLPDVVSPVSDGKFVLLITSGGRLTCYRCDDGKPAWDKQLDDFACRPSPVLVNGRLYLLGKDGTTLIARFGEKFEEIRRNDLGESCKASPAFAPGRIFIRTEKNLYAIGPK